MGSDRPATSRAATSYRFAPALLARSLGAVTAALGAVLLVLALLVAYAGVPGTVLAAVAVSAGLVLAAGALLMLRGAPLVRFDEAGYRVRMLRRAGVTQARWREVEDAVAATLQGHDCVVLRLRDGRTTTIPVRVLDASPQAFLDDLTARLDTGHGYRRLT